MSNALILLVFNYRETVYVTATRLGRPTAYRLALFAPVPDVSRGLARTVPLASLAPDPRTAELLTLGPNSQHKYGLGLRGPTV